MQELEKCDPKGRHCIYANSTQTFNCNVTCEGIYADVEWVKGEKPMEMMKGKNREELGRMGLMRLISEYKEFKRTHVQHFRFDSEANTTMFGKSFYIIHKKYLKLN